MLGHLVRLLCVACFMAAMSMAAPTTLHAQNTNAIVIKNFDFSPMSLTVKSGTTVTWTNLDGEPHTVTSIDGLFRSGALDTDDTYTFKFDKPGTYKYACSIHPRMMATIVVK